MDYDNQLLQRKIDKITSHLHSQVDMETYLIMLFSWVLYLGVYWPIGDRCSCQSNKLHSYNHSRLALDVYIPCVYTCQSKEWLNHKYSRLGLGWLPFRWKGKILPANQIYGPLIKLPDPWFIDSGRKNNIMGYCSMKEFIGCRSNLYFSLEKWHNQNQGVLVDYLYAFTKKIISILFWYSAEGWRANLLASMF